MEPWWSTTVSQMAMISQGVVVIRNNGPMVERIGVASSRRRGAGGGSGCPGARPAMAQ